MSAHNLSNAAFVLARVIREAYHGHSSAGYCTSMARLEKLGFTEVEADGILHPVTAGERALAKRVEEAQLYSTSVSASTLPFPTKLRSVKQMQMSFEHFLTLAKETPKAFEESVRRNHPDLLSATMEESDWHDQFVSYVEMHGHGPFEHGTSPSDGEPRHEQNPQTGEKSIG